MRGQKQREGEGEQVCPSQGQQAVGCGTEPQGMRKSPQSPVSSCYNGPIHLLAAVDQPSTDTREQISRVLIVFFFSFTHGSCSFSNFRVK